MRETIPDEVLSAADEVVLIDLTPEALIARLRAGKVYRPERVQPALNNFFKIENLAALRETALRQVAEDVEVKRLVKGPAPVVRRDEEGLPRADAQPQAIAERLLALATLAPESERVVRRAWRSAQRLDAELDVLVVRPPGRPASPQDRERLEALRRLVAMLGARLRVEEAEDVAAAAIATARELGSTYVLIGTPSARRGIGRLRLQGARPRAFAAGPAAARAARSSMCASSPTRRCAAAHAAESHKAGASAARIDVTPSKPP